MLAWRAVVGSRSGDSPWVVVAGREPPRSRHLGELRPMTEPASTETLRTLPGDDVRHVMWRMSERYDLHMFVQSVRAVARGPVARLVAEGARNEHDWTEKKA